MKKSVLFAFCLAIGLPAIAQESDFNVIRNLKTARSHIFNPMDPALDAPSNWIRPAQEDGEEMPLPGGMSESMRKLVDAERSRFNQSKIDRRGNYSGFPANADSLVPDILKGWDGSAGGGTPNDNHIAASNNGFVINVLNTVIRVTDETGKLLRAWSLEYFTNPPNIKVDAFPILTRVYDPRVLYDPVADRFIVLFMHGTTDKTSFIVVGFSSSNDPTKPWNVYRIPGKPTNDLIWSDYPIVAQNSSDLFFTVNLIGNGASWEEGFTEAIIWQLNKEDGFRGDTMNKNFYSNIKYQGNSLRSICAIQNGPMPSGNDNYFISVKPIDKVNDTVFLLRVTNTQKSGVARLEMTVLKSPDKYGFPPSALQPDTTFKLRTNDARVLSAVRIGNTIQYLQNSINFTTFQAHLTHNTIYRIADNPYIKARMITDDSLDFGYPAIAAAGKDENDPSVAITFVYSSPWHFPGMALMYCNRYGEYSKIIKVKKGNSRIHYSYIPKGEQRWGDYEGIQLKYNEPNSYYIVGSYGNNLNMHAWIAKIKLNDSILEQPVGEVRVFPVPTMQYTFVELKVEFEGKYSIDLVNMNGQVLRQRISMPLSGGTHKFRMDLNDLPGGTYVVRARYNNLVYYTQKIIVP